MNYETFFALIQQTAAPVVLIEGRRAISPELADSARRLSAFLANRFPHLIFRSGNANGADEAFTAGVLDVAPERLQVIAPYASHRKKQRHPLACYDSPESLSPDAIDAVKALSIAASPRSKGLIHCYLRGGRLASQAACLIRDTLKVTGIPDRFSPPTAALFCIDPVNPDAGGTGHTIRVCRHANVPVIFQNDWENWMKETSTH
jgi:hypothetical protein